LIEGRRNDAGGAMMDVLAPELLSQFIAAIYDCIIEPDGWSAVMRKICSIIDCLRAGILLCHLDPPRVEFLND
jgi:hypothetical protein